MIDGIVTMNCKLGHGVPHIDPYFVTDKINEIVRAVNQLKRNIDASSQPDTTEGKHADGDVKCNPEATTQNEEAIQAGSATESKCTCQLHVRMRAFKKIVEENIKDVNDIDFMMKFFDEWVVASEELEWIKAKRHWKLAEMEREMKANEPK